MLARLSLFALTGFALGTTAFAIPATLSIDFRTSAWSAAAGQSTKQIGDVTAQGSGVVIPLLGVVGPRPLSWNGQLGLGVDSNALGEDPTELGYKEVLSLSFGNQIADDATGAWVTKLFTEEGLFHNVTETGYVELYTGGSLLKTVDFGGLQPAGLNPVGDVFVDFGGAYDLSGAKFYARGNSVSDYSVAGLVASGSGATSFQAVPDGGTTLIFLGASLAGVGLLNRRRR